MALDPRLGLIILAFGTVTVVAGVEAVMEFGALLAEIELATESFCAALLVGGNLFRFDSQMRIEAGSGRRTVPEIDLNKSKVDSGLQ